MSLVDNKRLHFDRLTAILSQGAFLLTYFYWFLGGQANTKAPTDAITGLLSPTMHIAIDAHMLGTRGWK